MKKITFDLDEAKLIVGRMKEKYKFCTKDCPEWLIGISPALQQDGNYAISVCVPMFPRSIGDENSNQFLDGFEGMAIHLRGVGERNFGGKPIIENKMGENKQELIITSHKNIIEEKEMIHQETEPVEAKKIPHKQMAKRGLLI